jgi:hypothetical protein
MQWTGNPTVLPMSEPLDLFFGLAAPVNAAARSEKLSLRLGRTDRPTRSARQKAAFPHHHIWSTPILMNSDPTVHQRPSPILNLHQQQSQIINHWPIAI